MKEADIECPHRQSFYSVVWFVLGEGFNVIDFHEYQVQRGRMFLVNPNQITNWSYVANSKGYILMFAKSLASQLGIEFPSPYIDIEKKDAPLLRLVFENLVKDCKSNNAEVHPKIMASIQYFYSLIADKIPTQSTISQNLSGVSPKQHLLDLKMTEAKRLLLYSGLNISEIAFQLGFEDSSYFARIFKKKAKLSPSLFREKYRKI
jgi:hypothetical protein